MFDPGVPELNAESSQVVSRPPGAMVEAGDVDVFTADAAVVTRRRTEERREVAGDVQPDLFAEVPADDIGAVADAVGMT